MKTKLKKAAQVLALLGLVAGTLRAEQLNVLYQLDVACEPYGGIPAGWHDLIAIRPNRNWAVDGSGFIRPVLKSSTGLLVYRGPDGQNFVTPADIRLTARFKKTEEESVRFGIAARVKDSKNYYLARFSGASHLELLKIVDGIEVPLDFVQPASNLAPRPTGLVTRQRYCEGDIWTLTFMLEGNRLKATVFDADGREQASLESLDEVFKAGEAGLCCTTFAAASSFQVESAVTSPAGIRTEEKERPALTKEMKYTVVRPCQDAAAIDTPYEKIKGSYDVIIAGAGTGGWAAAVQAARLGARVLLLEPTDWIGGQMSCAGVTTMDEDSVWMKFPVRERGIYREFHESMALYYQTLNKDPFVAYYGYPDQVEGGYEPKIARVVLYGFIRDIRAQGGTLDLSLRSDVTSVQKDGDIVTGITVEFFDQSGSSRKEIACKVLVDATEYGDVIPLTGARYRVGNTTSEHPDAASLVQDHTWTAILQEYPDGVPEHLQIKEPPPGYETGSGRRYRNYTRDGMMLWGSAGSGIKGRRNWRVYFAWRGMADSDSPLTGERSRLRHTQCGVNGGNDYPVTAKTIESPDQRLLDEREGIHKTLGVLYYFQQELGINWSLAENEGYNTPYNQKKMKELNLRPDLEKIAVYLPQQPYVRECRRIIGVKTLVALDLSRFEKAKHFTTSVAMGDYFMDLDHGKTAHAIETDLDPVNEKELPRSGGPFQVPFEVFIPEKIDGFIPAEKNISQSRLVNGATRLQPITMLTGQAAGTIAALAVKEGVQPRNVDPIAVQKALLQAGSTLIQRWYSDVPWGSPVWCATQLLSLYEIMDRPGDLDRRNEIPLGSTAQWGVNKPLDSEEFRAVTDRLCRLKGKDVKFSDRPMGTPVSASQLTEVFKTADAGWEDAVVLKELSDPNRITAGEFAVIAARILTN